MMCFKLRSSLLTLHTLSLLLHIIYSDTDYLIRRGDSVNMTCIRALGTGIVWDVESTGSAVAIDGVLQDGLPLTLYVNGATQTLGFTNASMVHNEVYRCYTLFQYDFTRFNVTVLIPPADFVLVIPPANDGETITPSCISVASNPAPHIVVNVRYPNGSKMMPEVIVTDTVLSDMTTTRTSSMSLTASRDMNGAVINCETSIPEMNYQQVVSDSFYLNVPPDNPYILGADSSKPLYAGNRHLIQCVSNNGRPAATVIWRWDRNPVNGIVTIQDNGDSTYNVINTLVIDTLRYVHDGDLFECDVTSDAMPNVIYLGGSLLVYYPPVFTVSWDAPSDRLFEGVDLNFQCQIQSNPETTSSGWVLNKKEVVEDARHVIQDDLYQPNMYITSITSEDKGAYQCYGRNTVGTSYSDELTLQIIHKPVCKRYQIMKYAGVIGSTIEVECHIEAVPNTDLVFSWSTNTTNWVQTNTGKPYVNDQNYAHDTFLYTIRSEFDYRPIYCISANGMGSMITPCTIEVVPPGPADPPIGCETMQFGADYIQVECHEVFRGGSPVTYAIQLAKVNNMFGTRMNLTKPVFTIKDLEPLTTYFVRICAANRDFWYENKCGAQFQVKTMNGTVEIAPVGDDSSVSTYVPAIVIGCILALILVGILVCVVLVKVICRKKGNQHPGGSNGDSTENTSRNSSSVNDINIAVQTHDNSEMDDVIVAMGDQVTYSQVKKQNNRNSTGESSRLGNTYHCNEAFDSEENPYDDADGLKGSMRESVIEAIRNEGTSLADD